GPLAPHRRRELSGATGKAREYVGVPRRRDFGGDAEVAPARHFCLACSYSSADPHIAPVAAVTSNLLAALYDQGVATRPRCTRGRPTRGERDMKTLTLFGMILALALPLVAARPAAADEPGIVAWATGDTDPFVVSWKDQGSSDYTQIGPNNAAHSIFA